MKKFLFLFFILATFCLCSCSRQNGSANEQNSTPTLSETAFTVTQTGGDSQTEATLDIPELIEKTTYNHRKIKAVWLSQFDLQNVYTKNNKQRDESEFQTYIDQILQNLTKMGFNTLILQIRPYADSFYPSEIYPPSKYTVGSYANNFQYDPLPYIIERSHEKNISVQAWINPLRCMTDAEIKQVGNEFKIKQWYDSHELYGKYIVNCNNRLYLNPAYNEVRNLIVDGVNEILTKYDFDGIHMDDYFYPTTDASFDKIAFDEYVSENGNISLKNFRYNALNTLISDIYSTVKTNNKEKIFGISPAGNINTVVNEAFADVYTWCANEGYIDYICPQIYFGFQHQTHPFDKTLDMWSDIIKTDTVNLVAGITLGKAFSKEDKWAGSGKNEWLENNDVIKKSVEYSGNNTRCIGVSFFSYQYFYDLLTNKVPDSTKEEIDNMLPIMNNIFSN